MNTFKRFAAFACLARILAIAAFAQTPTVDVSKLPGAIYTPYYSMFPTLTNGVGMQNQAAFSKGQVDYYNQNAANSYNFAVSMWTNDALNARNAGKPLPVKPIAPLSEVMLRQDIPNTGSWIAVVDGPAVGVPCPDLPPAPSGTSAMCGLVPCNAPPQLTIDQKLDTIVAKLDTILAALKKAGL